MNADAKLTVTTNEGAKIFVNGVATKTEGAVREYVSRNLTPGFDYTYQVRAEIVRDGETLVKEQTIDLRAGKNRELDLAFVDAVPTETVLTVNVPADARVYLAGNETNCHGNRTSFQDQGTVKR